MGAAPLLALLLAALRVALGAMLLAAGAAKLAHRERWTQALAGYRLLPERLIAPAALLLPPVEVAAGLLLFAGGRLAALGALAAAGLLLAYAGAIAVNLLRGRHMLDCGCNPGGHARPISWPLAARSLALAGLAGLFLLDGARLPLAEQALAGLAGLAIFVLARTIATLASFRPA